MLLCRKLALFDEWNSLAVYVSMDNTVVIEDISEYLAGLPSRVVGYGGSSLPFRTYGKTLESPLDCKEIQPVNP